MNKQIQKCQIIYPVIIILLAAGMRLLPHPANVAPITAMALFGGIYMNKKYAFLVPLAALFISDIFLGFHDTMLFVYGSFVLTGAMGVFIKRYSDNKLILLVSVISSLQFFLITNFGVWLVGRIYPKTLSGLADAYIMAIPFFRNTLFGDLFYVGILFGSFAILQVAGKKITRERISL